MIELIIFDLGNVLVEFSFRKVIRSLKKHTRLSEKQIHAYFQKTPLWDAFERGHIAPQEFFKRLQKELYLTALSFEEFAPLWNNIFSEKHDTVSLLGRLRGHYRLAMLSNVNVMHWEHIRKQHAFMQWFDHPIASYDVGYRKPDAEIYRLTLHRAGVPPHRALFIDDVADHIKAAQSLGIRAHQFLNARQLQSALGEILE